MKKLKNYYGNKLIDRTVEEAFNVYKTIKENYIKEVANKYKIPEKLYQALLNYQVEVND